LLRGPLNFLLVSVHYLANIVLLFLVFLILLGFSLLVRGNCSCRERAVVVETYRNKLRLVADIVLVKVVVVEVGRILCLQVRALLLLLWYALRLVGVIILSLWRQEKVVERHLVFIVGLIGLPQLRSLEYRVRVLVIKQQLRAVRKALRRMTLTDHVKGLLGIAEYDLAA
jgi:hypothetical protein